MRSTMVDTTSDAAFWAMILDDDDLLRLEFDALVDGERHSGRQLRTSSARRSPRRRRPRAASPGRPAGWVDGPEPRGGSRERAPPKPADAEWRTPSGGRTWKERWGTWWFSTSVRPQ